MYHKMLVAFLAGFCILIASAGRVRAQEEVPRFEAGIQLTTLRLEKLQETPIGVGGRFHYNFHPALALDTEVSYFPEDPSGNFGETLALFGVRAGKRWESFGVFAKARGGVVHFGGSAFDLRLSQKSHGAFDLGGLFEYYAGRRVIVRVDLSDLVIPFGDTAFSSPILPPPAVRLGTQHNVQTSVGIAFRF